MATQTGPRLTITGRCEGCAWLHPIGAIRGLVFFCNEPSKRVGEFAKPTEIGRRPVTPAWCPELPAARLALARSVVAEAQPLAIPPPGDAAVNPKPATWDDGSGR